MKIYLLEHKEKTSFEFYDSCVVCAENESEAMDIHPHGGVFKEGDKRLGWVSSKIYISCTEIGEANDNQKKGVITASYISF